MEATLKDERTELENTETKVHKLEGKLSLLRIVQDESKLRLDHQNSRIKGLEDEIEG